MYSTSINRAVELSYHLTFNDKKTTVFFSGKCIAA